MGARLTTHLFAASGAVAMSDDDLLRLTLYVAGPTSPAQLDVQRLQTLLTSLRIEFELSVIDVLERPDLAEDVLILATPTLVKETPHPSHRLIGDLSDIDKVIRGLQIPVDLTKPRSAL